MAGPVFRGFPSAGVAALFIEPNQTGRDDDIDAPRNAPAKNPAAHLPNVIWHSEFFQYELAMPIQSVSVSHPALAGRQKYWGEGGYYEGLGIGYDPNQNLKYLVNGQVSSAQHTLVNHGLGYVPLAFVAYGGRMLMPGVLVQTASEGRNRFVAQYATSSIVGLREVMNASQNALGSVSRTYQVMVFRVPAAQSALPLFGRHGASVLLGRGKVDTAKTYLRRPEPGQSSPFSLDRGPTADIDNGRTRIVTGGVTTTEEGYGGSFSGPAFVGVVG